MPGAGVSTRTLPELFLGVAHVQASAEAFVRRILCELREPALPPTQRTVRVPRILEPPARALEVFVTRILCPASGAVPYALRLTPADPLAPGTGPSSLCPRLPGAQVPCESPPGDIGSIRLRHTLIDCSRVAVPAILSQPFEGRW